MSFKYVLPLLLLLASCGGGSGGSTDVAPTAPTPRVDAPYYGYFGSCLTCLAETQAHINLLFEAGWDGQQALIDDMSRAQLPTMLALPPAIGDVRALFESLRAANVLRFVIALYPQDEPDVAGMNETQVNALVGAERQLAAEYFELNAAKFAVIYGTQGTPGIGSFDWVGMDNYGAGSSVLGTPYGNLKAALRADQRIILVPGGASPWITDPAPFVERTEGDPQVLVLLPFLWRDIADHAGIRSNGMIGQYTKAGCTITAKC